MNEMLYRSQQERRLDSRSELQNKHLRVQMLETQGVPAAISSRTSSSSFPSSSQTAIAPSMQVDENKQDSSKKQTVTHGADMELGGLVTESERDRLQRYSACDFLTQAKENADVYLDRTFLNDRRNRETVKKELIQLGVHPSVHVAEVFQAPGLHVLSTDLVSTLYWRLICEQDGT